MIKFVTIYMEWVEIIDWITLVSVCEPLRSHGSDGQLFNLQE